MIFFLHDSEDSTISNSFTYIHLYSKNISKIRFIKCIYAKSTPFINYTTPILSKIRDKSNYLPYDFSK